MAIKITTRPWLDAALPTAQRVELLLGEMTLEEKLQQLGVIRDQIRQQIEEWAPTAIEAVY